MQGYIEFSKLSKKGVLIERSDELRTSIFNNVYEKTAALIKNIILEEHERCKNSATIEQQVDNVISFVGRRGTGKSSVMFSIREALKDSHNNQLLKIQEEEKINATFTVIDYIDASMLEEGEDILLMVVANMFSKLLDVDRARKNQQNNDYYSRQLYQLFDDVYGSLLSIKKDYKSDYKSYDAVSPLRELTKMSNSQTLGKTIRQLVARYLEYMNSAGRNSYNDNQHFLVITIDDVDMHFEKSGESPHEMLEVLHRYLMIPGVIILVTYDYNDLLLGCKKHFYDIYHSKLIQCNEEEEKITKRISKMAIEYLNKMFPIYSRVHMLSMKKHDYTEMYSLPVRVTKEDDLTTLKVFENNLFAFKRGNSVDISIKQFTLLLKASVAGLYYDAVGEKRHFAVPDGLRKLAQMYIFYEQLNSIQGDKYENKNQRLFKELLDELYFRFTAENLDGDEIRQLDAYLELPLERRGIEIVNDMQKFGYYSAIVNKGARDGFIYSYGELLYGLCVARREEFFSRKFTWCILDSYTIMLTKLWKEILAGDSKSEKAKNCFQKIIGESVAGSWSNLYVPSIQPRKIGETKENQDEEKITKDYRLFEDETVMVEAGAIRINQTKREWDFKLYGGNERELKEELNMLEILLMFYTEVLHYEIDHVAEITKGFKFTYDNSSQIYPGGIKNDPFSKDKINSTQLKIEIYDGCFNIMNFVVNLFLWDDFFEHLHEKLLPEYVKYFEDLNRDMEKSRIEGMAKDFISRNSLKTKYKNWYKKTHGFAMPLYSFDMMYNIMKRQYEKKGILPGVVFADGFFNYILKVYDGIGNLLKAEDEFYYSDEYGKINLKDCKFYQAYSESPFIDYIEELRKDKKLYKQFEDSFTGMIMSIAQD